MRIDFPGKYLVIEKRERDGALRGVDHYVFVVNPDRISFTSKGAE